MATNTYGKTEKTQLTKHFNISEFHCKGTACNCKETLHDPALSNFLQQIRDHFGKPIHITSGYRCAKHNAAVGGASGSRHTKGQAADFYIDDVEPVEIAAFAEQIGVLGIGLYDNFVHIDTRSRKSFWYGNKQEKRETFGGEAQLPAAYLVTCRVGRQEAVHTLVFDASMGSCMQRIGSYDVAVKMELENGNAVFSTVSIGTVHAEIVKIRKLVG